MIAGPASVMLKLAGGAVPLVILAVLTFVDLRVTSQLRSALLAPR
jgi:hypothetical protein